MLDEFLKIVYYIFAVYIIALWILSFGPLWPIVVPTAVISSIAMYLFVSVLVISRDKIYKK